MREEYEYKSMFSKETNDVMKRISDLEREYYNLEDDWLKDKSFKKLDRKYEIQKVFSELGIPLKDWGKK